MNRYDWILWAFRLCLSSDVINGAKNLVAKLEESDLPGDEKKKIVENSLSNLVSGVSVYLLRAIIEILVAQKKDVNP